MYCENMGLFEMIWLYDVVQLVSIDQIFQLNGYENLKTVSPREPLYNPESRVKN